jgi:EAL domain-containing protein (putative c-di-GMP-specific phosphodiesterase class I)/CheY-like chemotaxis protein
MMSSVPNRVLLVDDEPGMLRMLKAALAQYGFATEEALDGRQAMDLLSQRSFDVIVSDINMPRYSGLEFLRGVRERDPDVPVIMMTGKPSFESSAQAVEYGAFRYLIKPVMPAALKDAVERAIRLHEVARAKRQALELHGIDDKWLGDRALAEVRFANAMAELWIAFQPIVSWRERRVYGYEALVRSTEPTLCNPGLLLETAERLGKLRDLGRAIRGQAARMAPSSGAKLFVNLHSQDLMDDDLYSSQAPLSRLAGRVVLEITERASLESIRDLERRLARLRGLGFQLAVDDLGAGYAGLNTFTQLEPEVVKFDMSLIRDVDTNHKKWCIVSRMQEMCDDLGIVVVAEGIETPAERDTLVALGCDKLQGYLFAKPAPAFPAVNWGLPAPRE